MVIRNSALLALALAASTSAFTAPATRTAFSRSVVAKAITKDDFDNSWEGDLKRLTKKSGYKPGQADTELAKRFGSLSGAKVKTVGEAFADFTFHLGDSVNALYKNFVTDLVGTSHLIVANARFQRDAIWCAGILELLNLLLKNYPEEDIAAKIQTAFFKAMGMEEDEVIAEAKTLLDWTEGKTVEDVEKALNGEGDGPIAEIAKKAKADKYWMYSKFFGIGLVKVMEKVGVEMDKDEAYPIMEKWMSEQLGKPHLTACSDSDMYFKSRDKLDMMETMMKEIEIREKKRMAERLEAKAEAALRAAEKEASIVADAEAEKAEREAAKASS